MRLLNHALSDLKAYVRKEYSLTNNGSILVMLITEEEHTKLKKAYDNFVKANNEKEATQTDAAKEENSPNCPEFFPNGASILDETLFCVQNLLFFPIMM